MTDQSAPGATSITLEEAIILCHRVLHIEAEAIAIAYAAHGATLSMVKEIIAKAEKPTRVTRSRALTPVAVGNGVNGVHAAAKVGP